MSENTHDMAPIIVPPAPTIDPSTFSLPAILVVDSAGTLLREMTPAEHQDFLVSQASLASAPTLRSITPRQIRLRLLDLGITTAMVEAAIAGIEDATDRARAEIEWQYAVSYDRNDPLIDQIGGAFTLTPAQIDAAWAIAMTL